MNSVKTRLKDLSLADMYRKWCAGAGQYRCFVKPTCFSTLRLYPDFEIREKSFDDPFSGLGKQVLSFDAETLCIADLPGEKAVAAAFYLQTRYKIKPVITFNQVMHSRGLVGTREFAESLLSCSLRLDQKFTSDRYAFICDSERYDETLTFDKTMTFNNQYEITDFDLPDHRFLRHAGVAKILFLHEGEIKDDLKEFLSYYGDSGIQIIPERISDEQQG